jgi:hypothetical protein
MKKLIVEINLMLILLAGSQAFATAFLTSTGVATSPVDGLTVTNNYLRTSTSTWNSTFS